MNSRDAMQCIPPLVNARFATAVSGDRAMAEQTLAELEEKARHSFIAPSAYAIMRLGLGEKAKASA
jgi:hypothetical protein